MFCVIKLDSYVIVTDVGLCGIFSLNIHVKITNNNSLYHEFGLPVFRRDLNKNKGSSPCDDALIMSRVIIIFINYSHWGRDFQFS